MGHADTLLLAKSMRMQQYEIQYCSVMHSSQLWAVAVRNYPAAIGKFNILASFVLYTIPSTCIWPRLQNARYL
jgi:hypothetical protein